MIAENDTDESFIVDGCVFGRWCLVLLDNSVMVIEIMNHPNEHTRTTYESNRVRINRCGCYR